MGEPSSLRLEPDLLLSSQYGFTLLSRVYLQPEKMLMLAVLEDAFATFEKYLGQPNELFRREERWFMEEGNHGFFSFQNICDALGLDAHSIRQHLLRRSKGAAVVFGSPSPLDLQTLKG